MRTDPERAARRILERGPRQIARILEISDREAMRITMEAQELLDLLQTRREADNA